METNIVSKAGPRTTGCGETNVSNEEGPQTFHGKDSNSENSKYESFPRKNIF